MKCEHGELLVQAKQVGFLKGRLGYRGGFLKQGSGTQPAYRMFQL